MRLGLRLVKHLSQEGAARVVNARAPRAFDGIADMAERAALDRRDLEALAAADALTRLAGHRHRAAWQVTGVERALPLLPAATAVDEGIPLLRAPREGQDVLADYGSLGLTLRRHPLALLRDKLQRRGVVPMQDLWDHPDGKQVRTAGLVITRQRPGSASGVIFVTMEDETGFVNLIVWNRVAVEQRAALLESRLLEVHGKLQREGDVQHVIARRLTDLSSLLGELVWRRGIFTERAVMKLKDSVVLITGANRGIGLAFAQAALERGSHRVYAGARNPSSISLAGVEPLKLDVTSAADIAAAVKACGDVTLVVNNAGIGRPGSLLLPDAIETVQRHLETNLFGILRMMQGFAPVLARNAAVRS